MHEVGLEERHDLERELRSVMEAKYLAREGHNSHKTAKGTEYQTFWFEACTLVGQEYRGLKAATADIKQQLEQELEKAGPSQCVMVRVWPQVSVYYKAWDRDLIGAVKVDLTAPVVSVRTRIAFEQGVR